MYWMAINVETAAPLIDIFVITRRIAQGVYLGYKYVAQRQFS